MEITIFKVYFLKYISLRNNIQKVCYVIVGMIQAIICGKNCQAGFPFSTGIGGRVITVLLEELRQIQ